jgi:uncharacterized protein YbjT (DUF2867 family)
MLVTNEGDGCVSYVNRDDCAAAAAAVLASDGHDGKIYDITGPESLAKVRAHKQEMKAAARVKDDSHKMKSETITMKKICKMNEHTCYCL